MRADNCQSSSFLFGHNVKVEDLICFFFGCAFTIFYSVFPGKQIFIGHVIFLFFCVAVILLFLYKKIDLLYFVLAPLSLLSLVFTFFSAKELGFGERFYEDFVKVVMYFLFVPLIARIISEGFLSKTIFWYLSAFPIVFIALVFFSSGDLFSYSGRFYLDETGSPNVFGVFVALALLYIFLSDRWLGGSSFRIILALFYLLLIFFTASRSAILGVFFAFILSGVRSYSKLIFVGGGGLFLLIIFSLLVVLLDFSDFPILQKFNFYEDITEKGMSYRFDVWKESITQWQLESGAWFFGFGPGRVVMTLFVTEVPVFHPHSTFLFFLYSFGGVGLFIFVTWLFLLFLRIFKMDKIDSRFVRGALIFYLFVFLFDVHLSSSQFVPFHILMLSFIVSHSLSCRGNYAR